MSCIGIGSYEQQRLAKKKYRKKLANQFKTRFIAAWERYGEFQDVNGVRCFAGYRIDGDGAGQKRMSWLLKQPDLWEESQDKHFDWVKLYFNLNKIQQITDADVDAFFTYYKNLSHGRNADKLHYKLEQVTTPDDYGYYTTDKVVTEHWFEKKIVTVTQDEDGNDVETITWEKIDDDEYLEELSWELAYLDLQDAVWTDPDTLQPITEIVHDEELDEAALDAKIDGLRATEQFAGAFEGLQTVYVVPAIGDKIRDYTIDQSVGNNVLDDLEYVNYWGDDGTYYLSVDAAKKMNGETFMNLVMKTLDFRTKVKSKYKWRKFLLTLVAFVGAGVALFFGQAQIAGAILAGYVGGVSHSQTIKVLTQIATLALSPGAGGLASMSASEAINLILNVAALYFSMQQGNSLPAQQEEMNGEDDQRLFYRMPYDIYDDIYCFEDMISVSVEI